MTSAHRNPRLLARAAARAVVPVFVARGAGAADVEARLRASHRVRLLDSPRAATVLVVAGHVGDGFTEALARVHDQMAHPRATVWWTGEPLTELAGWPLATVVGPDGDIEAAAIAAHRDLLAGTRQSEPAMLADVDPVPWRGVGPYGHGGTGMTGGAPFGRPMAGRGDDRDGLTLDVVPVRVGPFLPLLPAGIVLEVTLAGDVIIEAAVAAPPASGGTGARLPDAAIAVFLAAGAADVRVADLERARAHHHLRWLARWLHLHGLDALARRVARAAVAGGQDAGELRRLARRLDRPWALGRSTLGVGVMSPDDAAAFGGPVARAAGLSDDARTASSSYAALGFEPVVHDGGDCRARWRQRVAEAAQSIELAARAGSAVVAAGEQVEPPAPPPPEDVRRRLAGLVVGAEWGDALATLASFDPDLAGAPSTASATQ